MKKWVVTFIVFLIIVLGVVAVFISKKLYVTKSNNQLFSSYVSLLEEYSKYLGSSGNHNKGEIEITLDPKKIHKIEKIQKNRLLKKGFSSEHAIEFSRVGVVAEDNYWIWLRDGVIFPSGSVGTYDRLAWKASLNGTTGVAVMPVTPDGRIALLLNYRHATRSWEIELPRGLRNASETPKQAASREVQEETGLQCDTFVSLGNMLPDSGCLNSVIPVFLGKVSSEGKANPEDSEAIASNLFLSKKEIKKSLKRGYMELNVQGRSLKAYVRDPFLTFALLQAEIRGVFSVL